MNKSADAFRTISEVADWLGVQTHVLRFWESKFSQVRPVKRAGGRRYYRPADMLLLGGIRRLLHDDGMTIKGAQKILREEGVAFVADLSQPLDDLTAAEIDKEVSPQTSFAATKRSRRSPATDDAQPELPLAPAQPPIVAEPIEDGAHASTEIAVGDDLKQSAAPSPALDVSPPQEDAHVSPPAPEAAPEELQPSPEPEAPEAKAEPVTIVAEAVEEPPIDEAVLEDMVPDMPRAEPPAPAEPDPSEAAQVEAPARKPDIVDAPDGPAHEDIPASVGLLSRLSQSPKPEARAALPELRTRLAALRDRMAQADPR